MGRRRLAAREPGPRAERRGPVAADDGGELRPIGAPQAITDVPAWDSGVRVSLLVEGPPDAQAELDAITIAVTPR